MRTDSHTLSCRFGLTALGYMSLVGCLLLGGCAGSGQQAGLGSPAGGGGPGVSPEDDNWESTVTIERDEDPLVARVTQYAQQIADADRRDLDKDKIDSASKQGQIADRISDLTDEPGQDGQAMAADLRTARVMWTDRHAWRASTRRGDHAESRAQAMLRTHSRVGSPGDPGDPGETGGLREARVAKVVDVANVDGQVSTLVGPTPAQLTVASSPGTIELVSAQIQHDASQSPQLRALKLAMLSSISSDVDVAALLSDAQLTRRQGRELVHFKDFLVSLREDIAGGLTQLSQSVIEKHLQKVYAHQPITIGHVALTRSVTSYGVYEPFADSRFLAGKENAMIVYVELDHFRVSKTASSYYQVRLAEELELYTDQPNPTLVWRQPRQEVIDESLNHRRDFFIRQLIRLPASLSVGKYILNVRVTDVADGSIDERKLPITIVADARLVGRVDGQAKQQAIEQLIQILK